MSWWNRKNPLFEQIQDDLSDIELTRWERKRELVSNPSEDNKNIKQEILGLKRIVRAIQKNGVSMWNYKQVLPRIFDVISGAFNVVEDLTDEVERINKNIEIVNKRIDTLHIGINQAFDRMDENKLTKVVSKK